MNAICAHNKLRVRVLFGAEALTLDSCTVATAPVNNKNAIIFSTIIVKNEISMIDKRLDSFKGNNFN